MGAFKDLTGQRFGRLIVLESMKRRINKKIVWKCLCDCGNIAEISRDSLVSGATKSCGCLHKERSIKLGKGNAKDLTHKRYGRLIVLRRSKYMPVMGKREVGWLCQCDCGNFVLVKSTNLIRGNTKSCGCLWKEHAITHGLSKTKEYIAMKTRRRNERKKHLDIRWTLEMELALKELQTECILCDSVENLAVDHVLPLSKGHGLVPGNAVVLCNICNARKNNKNITELPLEWQVNLIWNAFKFKDYWDNKHLEKSININNFNFSK